MRKTTYLMFLAALMLFGTVQVSMAQQRRGTTVRKTTTTRKTTTPQKAPVAPPVKKFAIYDLTQDTKGFYVGTDYIYAVQSTKNNAVIGINRKTGGVETIIAGIEGIYEGARPRIDYIFQCGDKLVFSLEKGGVYVYDGKSVKTSTLLNKSGYVVACSKQGGYLLVSNDDLQTTLWDINTVKPVITYSTDYPFDHRRTYLASDGGIWTYGITGGELGATYLKGKNIKTFSVEANPYIQELQANGRVDAAKMSVVGDYLYWAVSRRVFRINMKTPTTWEEYAKIPATEDNRFKDYCVNEKGDILNHGSSTQDYNTEFFRAGSLDSPKALGRYMKTGLSTFDFTEVYPSLCVMEADADNNFVFRRTGRRFYIYNPDGVVGYAKAKGTILKF